MRKENNAICGADPFTNITATVCRISRIGTTRKFCKLKSFKFLTAQFSFQLSISRYTGGDALAANA